ncbi:MAG: aa3-type cytochrome c oxidase subunit IV [Paracoccaceae bacterium]|nr:aa3-type cytochrome c oxidase subunit IV [Paracoccaceae bacterium]
MAEEKHEIGKMNIETQEKTFEGFMRWVVNGTIVIIVVLILLAITGT